MDNSNQPVNNSPDNQKDGCLSILKKIYIGVACFFIVIFFFYGHRLSGYPIIIVTPIATIAALLWPITLVVLLYRYLT